MAFTVIMILAPQNYYPSLKPFHFALITGALASGAYVLCRISGTAGPVRSSPAINLAVALLLWALVTVPFSLWPGGSIAEIFGVFIKAIIVFWLLARVVNSVPRLRMVALILVLLSIPLSLSGIISFLHDGIGTASLDHGFERITGYNGGLTANPNDLALMINLTLPFTIGLLLLARSFAARALLASIAFLDCIAVLATYSRGGFLTLMTIIAAYLLCLNGKARRVMVIAILAVGIIAIPMIPSGYYTRISTITDIQADQTNSAQERWGLMVRATNHLIEHPIFGAGAGLDYIALRESTGKWQNVHNIYLEYAADLGIPGLLMFLMLYYTVFKSVRRARSAAWRKPGHEVLFRLSESIWIVLIAFGVSSFFHPIAYDFYFYYMAGLAVAVGSISKMIFDAPHAGGRIA